MNDAGQGICRIEWMSKGLNRIFHKSVLAVAIGSCAAQAMALNYDVSQGPLQLDHVNVPSDVTLSGTVNLQAGARDVQYEVQKSTIGGSLINNATLNIDANGYIITGLGVAPGFDYLASGVGDGGTVNGDVRNAGHISITNIYGAEGLEVGNARVTGSVINSGTISMTQSNDPNLYGAPEGMYLHGSRIEGDVVNSGTIDVAGTEAVGLYIDEHGGTPFYLGGQLLNSGTIHVVGDRTAGLEVWTATSPLTIVNTGTIAVQGTGVIGDTQAITLRDGMLDVLRNSGQITASGGPKANAIILQGINFTTRNPSGARGIVNTGTISAEDDAIVVTADAPRQTFEINQQGGSISSTSGAAVKGDGLAVLNWSAGSITGDLLQMAAVNVKGPAAFYGSTIDSNVAIDQGAALNLNGQGSHITGNLDIAGQGSVGMLLSNATANSQPYLTVGGSANFASGSHITLSANPGDFTPTTAGQRYALLTANSVQDNGLSVNSSSALLNVASYTVDANSVAAVVTLKSDQQVGGELGNVGVDQPVQVVVNRFKNAVLGQLQPSDPVYQSFANAGNAEQLAKLGKQLSPEVSRGGVDAAIAGQHAASNAISSRMNVMRSGGLSSGDAVTDAGVWAQALDSNMDQDSRGGVAGYSANASGVVIGADGKLDLNTTVGISYTYLNANVTADTGNKTDVQGNALALYGAWQQGPWFSQGNVSYGRNDNDSKRYVAGTLAKGSFDSDVFSVDTLAGYAFDFNDHVLLEPRLAARYANVQVDGYSEHGSSAALRNQAQRFESGEVGAGLRIAGATPLFAGVLQPEATLMAYHDLIGDRINQTSAFTQGGSAFAVTGAKPARDSYEASVGVNYSLKALTLGASYNYQARSGFDADTLMFKARYSF